MVSDQASHARGLTRISSNAHYKVCLLSAQSGALKACGNQLHHPGVVRLQLLDGLPHGLCFADCLCLARARFHQSIDRIPELCLHVTQLFVLPRHLRLDEVDLWNIGTLHRRMKLSWHGMRMGRQGRQRGNTPAPCVRLQRPPSAPTSFPRESPSPLRTKWRKHWKCSCLRRQKPACHAPRAYAH